MHVKKLSYTVGYFDIYIFFILNKMIKIIIIVIKQDIWLTYLQGYIITFY